jgi:hypothetical protein
MISEGHDRKAQQVAVEWYAKAAAAGDDQVAASVWAKAEKVCCSCLSSDVHDSLRRLLPVYNRDINSEKRSRMKQNQSSRCLLKPEL